MKSKEDDFIGKTFSTREGGTLEVLYHNGLKKNKKKYILSCSICSEDDELWSEGSITSQKSHLRTGRIPCACSKHTMWKESQYKVLVKRACTLQGLIFEGFLAWRNRSTKLKLYNPHTGNRWSSNTINNLLHRGVGDPKLGVLNEDKYTEHVVEESKQKGVTFLGWDGEFVSGGSYFNYICNKGHTNRMVYTSFKRKSFSCTECNDGFANGYYPSRKDEPDSLYIYLFNDKYIKIGRSFNLVRRQKELIKASSCNTATLLHTFSADHQTVYNLEQHIHAQLRAKGLDYDSGWTSESFKLEALDLALELVSQDN